MDDKRDATLGESTPDICPRCGGQMARKKPRMH